jgi:hypothetical protein
MPILSAVSSDRNQGVVTCLERFLGVGNRCSVYGVKVPAAAQD